MHRIFIVSLIVQLLLIKIPATAENWPGWRGPRGDGTSLDAAPTKWDGATGENVKWKAALPGEGHASPVVWGDHVFITLCLPDSELRQLVCLDRKDGSVRWKRTVLKARLESKHALNSYASSTPATDGRTIFVTFLEASDEQVVAPNVGNERLIYPGTMVVAAYDFEGNQKWLVRPGGFVSAHGFCTNPVLFDGKVILNGDHDGDSYLVALDMETGSTLWKTSRRHGTRSYVTPLLRKVNDADQLVLAGSKCLAGFDPLDGTRLWNIEGPTEQFVASMVDDGELFFSVAGYPTYHAIAVRPDGRGDVTDTHVAWHVENVRCYVPSPVVCNGYLIVADDRGTANCFDCKSGKRFWQTRMGKHYSGSLVTARGLVYFVADDGITKLLEPGPTPKVIAQNSLGEETSSSPAISDGQLFIRGMQHLFCIAP